MNYPASPVSRMEETQSLGVKIDWALRTHGGPKDIHIYAVLAVLSLSTIFAYSISYIILEFVLFTGTNEAARDESEPVSEFSEEQIFLKPTDTFLSSNLDTIEFANFIVLFTWSVMIVTALGLELFVWRHLLVDGWSSRTETAWRFAQFLFPVMGVISTGLALHQNAFTYGTTVLWCWKFGFPEILATVHSGLYNKSQTIWHRLCDIFNGVGSLLHHSVCALALSVLAAGLPLREWHPKPVLMNAFLALGQHLLTPLYYTAPNVYIVLVLLMEVAFEWSMFSDIENLYRGSWMLGALALVMLFAHWLYLAAGAIDLVLTRAKTDGDTDELPSKEEQEQEETKHLDDTDHENLQGPQSSMLQLYEPPHRTPRRQCQWYRIDVEAARASRTRQLHLIRHANRKESSLSRRPKVVYKDKALIPSRGTKRGEGWLNLRYGMNAWYRCV
eukprot:scaffold35012_cov214-Amphora_coffeaeformis.AAC.6